MAMDYHGPMNPKLGVLPESLSSKRCVNRASDSPPVRGRIKFPWPRNGTAALLAVVFLLSFFGVRTTTAAQTRSPFSGDWEITFSGRDNGSGRFSVRADGHIRGTGHFQTGPDLRLDGVVEDNGELDCEFGGAEFFGKALPNGTAYGNWRNSKFERAGGWSARRADPSPDAGSKRGKQK